MEVPMKRPRNEELSEAVVAPRSLSELASNPPKEVLSIFELGSAQSSMMEIPDPFKPSIQRWYGQKGDEEGAALKRARVQTVLDFRNKWTLEHSTFNVLRGLRPVVFSQVPSSEPTPESCDFCKPLEKTAADEWGRVETAHCISASNASKWAAVCGVMICKEHDRLNFDCAKVKDYFDACMEYLDMASKHHNDKPYPLISWQNGKLAGGSQPHGHLQAALTPVRYGEHERWLRLSKDFPGDYIAAFVKAHESAGLARHFGQSTVFPSLCPRADGEILVVGLLGTEDFAYSVFVAMRTVVDALGNSNYNMAVWMPTWKEARTKLSIARVLPRDKEICGVTLFGGGTMSTDPYRIADALDQVLNQQQ